MSGTRIPDGLTGIITLRFTGDARVKFEDIRVGQTTNFVGLIDETTQESYDIEARWTWKEEYPNSFVAKFEATLKCPVLGEVHINYGRPEFDAILLRYNNLNE